MGTKPESKKVKTKQGVGVDVNEVVRRKNKLKLFVWTGFCPDYTSGLAFAIANDETEARRLIEKEKGHEPYQWGDLEIYSVRRKVAKSVTGGG